MKTTICLALLMLPALIVSPVLIVSPALAQSGSRSSGSHLVGYHPVNVPPGLHNPRLPSEQVNYQPGETVPPGTPRCGHAFSAVPCYFGTPPGGYVPPRPMAPVFREETRWLQTHRLDQSGGAEDTVLHTLRFRALNPDLYPVHAPLAPGQAAALCPSCQLPDGSRWAHQPPLLVGGRLLRRTPDLIVPSRWHWTRKFALELAFWVVLLTGSTYLVVSFLQDRNLRLHDERVAARAVRARARAEALEARRTLLGG